MQQRPGCRVTVGSDEESGCASETRVPNDRKTSNNKTPASFGFSKASQVVTAWLLACYPLLILLTCFLCYVHPCTSPTPTQVSVLAPASLLEVLTYLTQLSTVASGTKSVRVNRQPSCSPWGEVGMVGFASFLEPVSCRHRLLSSLGRLYPENQFWSPKAEVKRNGLFNHWLLPFHPISFHLFPIRRLRTDQNQRASAQVIKTLETENQLPLVLLEPSLPGPQTGRWPPRLSPQIICLSLCVPQGR